jgi:DNA polymerase family A
MLLNPAHLMTVNDKTYCWLIGEIDKESFAKQCAACPLQARCTTKREYLKAVAGDWHSLNAEGFFGAAFTEGNNDQRKELRAGAKIGGLALCYGGYYGTIMKNFGCTEVEAKRAISNFFRKLMTLNKYMIETKAKALKTGMTFNLFGRMWDLTKYANPPAELPFKVRRRTIGEAERKSLNHPIQSTASEFLKIGSIRADHVIRENGWSPYSGDSLQMEYANEAEMPSYKDFIVSNVHSNHDELVYMIRDDSFEEVIPQIYIAMQLKDIMEAFDIGFTLELDCEFDKTRAWTAQERFDSARIYLLREVAGFDSLNGLPVTGGARDTEELSLADLDLFTTEIKQSIQAALDAMRQDPDKFSAEEQVHLASISEGEFFRLGAPLAQSLFEQLGLEVKPAQMTRE